MERFTEAEGPVVVLKDGRDVSGVLESSNAAFAWLLRHQGQSVDYATRYGGYQVVAEKDVEQYLVKDEPSGNDAYPNGRCPGCGSGLSENLACHNGECPRAVMPFTEEV